MPGILEADVIGEFSLATIPAMSNPLAKG